MTDFLNINHECDKLMDEIRSIKKNEKWAKGKNLFMHQGLNNIKIYEKILEIRKLRNARLDTGRNIELQQKESRKPSGISKKS